MQFPTNSYHLLTVELTIKAVLALLSPYPSGYAKLMSPNKGNLAVHGCHCSGDMVVGMHKVLAIPRRWYVCFSAVNC